LKEKETKKEAEKGKTHALENVSIIVFNLLLYE